MHLGRMAARTRRARVTGIGGIFFKAKNPAGMADWYRDYLGIPIEDSVALFAWRGGKDGKAHGHTVWSIFPADTKYFGEDSAPFMINYRVKDLDRLREALRRLLEEFPIDPSGPALPPAVGRSGERVEHAKTGVLRLQCLEFVSIH